MFSGDTPLFKALIMATGETQKQILFASRYAYMYYQSVSDAFQDYSLSFTQNGKQAISYLKRNKPSVVILSKNLKELDTLKLCKAIRKSSRLASTKILLLVPDEKNLNDISDERKANVDIILKQSQKPSSFVTHIGKLLKASAEIEANLEAKNNGSFVEEEKLVDIDNATNQTVNRSQHLTPFPDAAENIYLFQDDEVQETVAQPHPVQNHIYPSTHCSENQNTTSQTVDKKAERNADRNFERTIKQIAIPISPPNSPINKAVHEQSQTQTVPTSSAIPTQQSQSVQSNRSSSFQSNIGQDNIGQDNSVQSSNVPRQQDFAHTNYPEHNNNRATRPDITEHLIDVDKQSTIIQDEAPIINKEKTGNSSSSHLPTNFEANIYGADYGEAEQTKTIAIIEDNASIAFLEKSILERQGYNTIQIADAPQAREFVDTNFDMADLILLDLNLPGGSGFEILRRIRSFSRKPVIIVSGLKQSENIKRGLSLGAQDYLTKPMNPQELILRVSQHIKNFT